MIVRMERNDDVKGETGSRSWILEIDDDPPEQYDDGYCERNSGNIAQYLVILTTIEHEYGAKEANKTRKICRCFTRFGADEKYDQMLAYLKAGDQKMLDSIYKR